MADVKLSTLTKTFGDVVAVDNMNLEVKDREFFVLLGPTGAGKTTTLRMIAGLEKQDRGHIKLDDTVVDELPPALRDVAMVFQYYTLYPNYTVRQNLEFPLKSKFRTHTREEINKRVEEVAKTLHIERLLDRETIHLSGGEMQRVGLGRAMVRTPKVFLMDEPLSNLDAKLREEMRRELARLHYDMGATFFYVTHDQVEALTMGDRVGVLNEGKMLQIGPPEEIYNRPRNIFVATFVGSPLINIFEAEIQAGRLVIGKNEITCTLTDRQNRALKEKYNKKKLMMGIRPEDISVQRRQPQGEFTRCSVYFNQSMGAEDILNLRIDDIMFRAIAPPKIGIQVGETLYACIDMETAHLFDQDTEERIM
ncbi:MAG: ABC transporter ATP-binding protein [Spirochaetota bacterium]